MFTDYLHTFYNKPIRAFDPLSPLPDNAADFAWRLFCYDDPDWYSVLEDRAEEEGEEFDTEDMSTLYWDLFCKDPNSVHVEALVFGVFGEFFESESFAGWLSVFAQASSTLPNLKALFFPDVTYEDSEVSWIELPDPAPFLQKFPKLEELGMRGGFPGQVGHVNLPHLRKLVVESGGLSGRAVRAMAGWNLPNLEHLQLFLGSSDYGGDATTDDIAPYLTGKLHPKLRYLGLCNSEIQGDITRAILGAPILEQLTHLDVSRGTLQDNDARLLLACPPIRSLTWLDVSENFLSEDMDNALKALPITVVTGTEKDLPDEDDDDPWLYCSVAE